MVTFSAVLVAVGSYNPRNKKSEKYEDGSWSEIQEPPLVSLSDYAAIFHADSFYYFGGFESGSGYLRSILRLNATSWAWSNAGQMKSSRRGHAVILVKNTFMVIGGGYTRQHSACLLNNGKFSCEEKSSSLTDYVDRPMLFLVNDSYENC